MRDTHQNAGAPSALIDIWLGHIPTSVRERSYSQLRKDIVKRQQWCQQVGLGFDLNYNELQKVMLAASHAAKQPYENIGS